MRAKHRFDHENDTDDIPDQYDGYLQLKHKHRFSHENDTEDIADG